MKRALLILGVFTLISLSSCHSEQGGKVLISRTFKTASWERFDYVEKPITLNKPVSYDLELDAWFDDSYPFNYFAVVFTVFDTAGNPLRSKDYKFTLKDRDGVWKSQMEEGRYHFRFPLNSNLTLNDPDTYVFQIENHMPITPLLGIREVSIISK